jgi:hypothetical protein
MTPQEKAEQLVEKYMLWKFQKCELSKKQAKQCALIAVNEIMNAIDWHNYDTPNKEWGYWQEVKTEIIKL